jgi:hypothetical protein
MQGNICGVFWEWTNGNKKDEQRHRGLSL